MSTFVEIFRFELAHRVRHWSTWLYFAVMAGTVWLLLIDLMIGESEGSGAVHANAPATVAMAMTIGAMVMLIATAGSSLFANQLNTHGRREVISFLSSSRSGVEVGE